MLYKNVFVRKHGNFEGITQGASYLPRYKKTSTTFKNKEKSSFMKLGYMVI